MDLPSSPAYRIHQGESVFVQVFSSVAVTLAGRFRIKYDDPTLGEDDMILPDTVTGTGRLPEYIPLREVARGDGYVVEGVVDISGASSVQPKRGQTYLRYFISLPQTGEPVARDIITEGYVYRGFGLALGMHVEPGPGGGEGVTRSIDLGDPAAGVEYTTQVVPTNALWKLRGFAGTLDTDGNASDRRPTIVFNDGTNDLIYNTGSFRVTANQIIPISAYAQMGVFPWNQAVTNAVKTAFSLSDASLLAGFEVQFSTQGLLAGDNWGSGQLLVEEWISL